MADQLNGASNAVCFTLWFKTHTNHRYAQLFNRLDPLVRFYKVPLSRHGFCVECNIACGKLSAEGSFTPAC